MSRPQPMTGLATVVPGKLTLACIDSAAAPLFDKSPDGIVRTGYEPAVAELVSRDLGLELSWSIMEWDEMIPAVQAGTADAVWCGQGIIPDRVEQLDFTRPYAIFNETVLVRSGDPATGPSDLAGYRVAAIEGSANMNLALSFKDANPVPFPGTADVFGDMIAALRDGRVDAMVDDDVVTVPLGEDPDFKVAFTAPTANPWGLGVARTRPDLLQALDTALARCIADGFVREAWERHMPQLPYPHGLLASGRITQGVRQ